ncbi:MAG TPA: magnesium transporter CorA family protein [Roseiflexaceae bacterium]|nr:magnesium transporter CorA family protein [Roseiflexaceae bacterium]
MGELPAMQLAPAPKALQRHFEVNDLQWLDLAYPSNEQLSYLQQRFDFHPLHLEDVHSRIQRPKIDENEEPEYLFLVLHFPVFNEVTRLSVVSEVDIFVGQNYLVTTHDTQLRPLMRLLQSAEQPETRNELMARGSGYLLYRIIETLVDSCFPMLYKLDMRLDRLEETIFEQDVQTTVQELSFVRRDIIALRRIIRPNIPVVRLLAAREHSFLRVDEDVYFGDLVDGLTRLWDMLEEHKEIIEGLDATLSSLTSHRINRETKLFTLISIIFLPMTLVASILGMNVMLPYAEHPLALPLALGFMALLGAGMLLYFRHKGWV